MGHENKPEKQKYCKYRHGKLGFMNVENNEKNIVYTNYLQGYTEKRGILENPIKN